MQASDVFTYLSDYQVIVCRHCRYAVWPSEVRTHLQGRRHRSHHSQASSIATAVTHLGPLAQTPASFRSLRSVPTRIKHIPLYTDGLQCRLRPADCDYICRSDDVMRKHWRQQHNWSLCGSRGGGAAGRRRQAENKRQHVVQSVCCQRFFHTRSGARYFAVLDAALPAVPTAQVDKSDAMASVFANLDSLEAVQCAREQTVVASAGPTEVSPWLQMTRWTHYLDGFDLVTTAGLADLPRTDTEPVLAMVCESVDRLIESAYAAVCDERINVFDQTRINSFMQKPRAIDRPLLVKLQKPTYRRYKNIWKALLCFVYRSALPDQEPKLRHRLTTGQSTALDRLAVYVEQLLASSEDLDVSLDAENLASAMILNQLDQLCLAFCISLLDHDLKQDLFESAVIGYLAVAGINREKQTFRDACQYGSTLSGFIKIAQLLVIQRAVESVEAGQSCYVSDLLDEMRDRFMVHGTRSPFSWANRMRMYAKKIRDSTTSLGHIEWTNDGQSVSYKDVSNFRVQAMRTLVRTQVTQAQTQLEELLLLDPIAEHRQDLDIHIRMHQLVDRPAESSRGWSFLDHRDNRDGPLPHRRRWLLERVLRNERLRERFIDAFKADDIVWRRPEAVGYKLQVDAFLEQLLLLIHLTSGQPARGTEILSLRYKNSLHGQIRNVFLEDGLVSTVTSYHKGYAVTGSTKIIHRYLPREVGELLIYYLWLVLPFVQALNLLALGDDSPPSPFLWAKGRGSWDSNRLSSVLSREFKAHLGVRMTIPVYRHLSIAISRKHLPCGGFKRDYGLENTKFDAQSAHSSWTAGCIYARGLEEAPGHVKSRKALYRTVSQEWHGFLGFATSLKQAEKRPLTEVGSKIMSPRKRQCTCLTLASPDA